MKNVRDELTVLLVLRENPKCSGRKRDDVLARVKEMLVETPLTTEELNRYFVVLELLLLIFTGNERCEHLFYCISFFFLVFFFVVSYTPDTEREREQIESKRTTRVFSQ